MVSVIRKCFFAFVIWTIEPGQLVNSTVFLSLKEIYIQKKSHFESRDRQNYDRWRIENSNWFFSLKVEKDQNVGHIIKRDSSFEWDVPVREMRKGWRQFFAPSFLSSIHPGREDKKNDPREVIIHSNIKCGGH